jgi:hypothetical protein
MKHLATAFSLIHLNSFKIRILVLVLIVFSTFLKLTCSQFEIADKVKALIVVSYHGDVKNRALILALNIVIFVVTEVLL